MILTGADLDHLLPSSGSRSEFYGNFYAVSFLLRKVKNSCLPVCTICLSSLSVHSVQSLCTVCLSVCLNLGYRVRVRVKVRVPNLRLTELMDIIEHVNLGDVQLKVLNDAKECFFVQLCQYL